MVLGVSGVVLGIFGAIGGLQSAAAFARGSLRTARMRIGRKRQAPKDYYWKRVEIACRVESAELYRCIHIRDCVSRCNDLQGFEIGAGPIESMDIQIRSLDDCKIIDSPIRTLHMQKVYTKLVEFPKPLAKGKVKRAIVAVDGVAKQGKQIDPHSAWQCERRIDHLVLRVVFVNVVPTTVDFEVCDSVGRPLQKPQHVAVDKCSQEARVDIPWPHVATRYALTWRFS